MKRNDALSVMHEGIVQNGESVGRDADLCWRHMMLESMKFLSLVIIRVQNIVNHCLIYCGVSKYLMADLKKHSFRKSACISLSHKPPVYNPLQNLFP